MTLGLAAATLLASLPITYGQGQVPPPVDAAPSPTDRQSLTLSGVTWRWDAALSDPVVDADAQLQANAATSWTADGARFLLLDGDVRVNVGTYGFRASRAVVRIDTDRAPGVTAKHLAIYLDDARSLTGKGNVKAQGRRMLVTAATRGEVKLITNDLRTPDATTNSAAQDAVANDALVAEAQGRFERYLAAIGQPTLAVSPTPMIFSPEVMASKLAARKKLEQQQMVQFTQRLEIAPPQTDGSPAPTGVATTPPRTGYAGDDGTPTTSATDTADTAEIMPAQGTVAFNADRIVYAPAQEGREASVALIGQVRVLYNSADGLQALVLQADNVVMFLAEGDDQPVTGAVGADRISGIYLEDDVVITDGSYTVRAPRVFYDLRQNKAVLLEAVFYTFDVSDHIPLYMRAQTLRQESRSKWTARDATLTTSDFAEPHIAIRASKMTVSQRKDEDGQTLNRFSSTHTRLNWGHVPVFYWPYVTGEFGRTPLRGASVNLNSENGIELRTRWDIFALAGRQKPEGVDLTGSLDYLGDHGPAVGVGLNYNMPEMFGTLDAYALLWDNGKDTIGGRLDVPHDADQRGFAHWQHRHYLPSNWELSLELAAVSDETFLEEFFPTLAHSQRQWETSAYLKHQSEDSAVTLLTRYEINDFTTQLTTLQAPGYTVDKLPELGYYRVGTSLWDDRLTYFSETRLSYMRIRGGHDTPLDRGFPPSASLAQLGLPNTTRFVDDIRASGIPTDYRTRLDSRHEIDAPLRASIFDITPFVAGRFTAYDDDFAGYRGEQDQFRVMGTLGTRYHTQFSNTGEQVSFPLLDVHRLRHIIEPNGEVWHTASTLNPEDIPVYDYDVEALTEGFGTRFGLRNTLQTQRGGPGRWRSVDWLVLDTDFIHRSGDGDNGVILPRHFAYRPEYSIGGDQFYSRLLWHISDSLASASEASYSLESDQLEQWRTGLTFRQSPYLTLGIDYKEIDALQTKLVSTYATYQITRRYAASLSYTYDIGAEESRAVNASLERKMPGWRLVFTGSYDVIQDETLFGVQFFPEGERNAYALTPTLGTYERY